MYYGVLVPIRCRPAGQNLCPPLLYAHGTSSVPVSSTSHSTRLPHTHIYMHQYITHYSILYVIQGFLHSTPTTRRYWVLDRTLPGMSLIS
jgi:hypothetical protein